MVLFIRHPLVVYENINGKLEFDNNIHLKPLDEWQDPKEWAQWLKMTLTPLEHLLQQKYINDVNSDGLMDALCSNVAQDFKSANLFLLNKGNMQFDVLNPDQVNRWVDWLE